MNELSNGQVALWTFAVLLMIMLAGGCGFAVGRLFEQESK